MPESLAELKLLNGLKEGAGTGVPPPKDEDSIPYEAEPALRKAERRSKILS